MNKQKTQKGNVHLIIIIVLVTALLGTLGFIYWQNFVQTKTSTGTVVKTDATADWQTYTNSSIGYTLRYPAGWSFTEVPKDKMTLAIASTYFNPSSATSGVVTVSSYKSDLSPKTFIESNSTHQLLDSNQNSINGNNAYYYKDGDDTYINRGYAISHNGIIVTVSITEMAKTPSIDNSQYIDQFNLIAKSIKF